MNIDFPFHFDNRGRTAATDDDDHIRDMIEEFLFTNPGERVNRPDFGSGLLQMVFAPNSPELAAALAVHHSGRAATLAGRSDRRAKSRSHQRGFDAARARPIRGQAHRPAANTDIYQRRRVMTRTVLTCQSEQRRERVRGSSLMGLDYLEVSHDQMTLTVYFLGNAPERSNRPIVNQGRRAHYRHST